ncbi:MFS transporter [Aetokthonos hydrillicola Thurmond2011]|jgi:MFS family permease|uniref:MFS transporter n=1 Tax=Aetokthonos hydrillicola Thurmond2011 TaxID=2712845 RepID=A0AAP5I8F7_9CYAN|nr:MFS transporter [Aetokthonos hydrillicola]MBO3463012.1 MFS transporter [Aetokthonos hydrillicola CCALA 1050]MBW4587185.1 MFS transporter [Aetokthonos hydrillicola CCALA 1050]MDR9896791.1 MFS transporter [Aetokthonos hydrillicola Thurmond2011]
MQTATVHVGEVRWRIPIVLAVTVFVNYLDRNNLSLALPRIAQDFGWTDREIGSYGQLLLAAFFVPYGLSNMLLSPLAERFGPKRSVIAAITAFSVFTILNALLGQSLTALILLRLLLGLGEGVHIPMLSALTSRWFPVGERSRANAIWVGGIMLASATAPLMVVPLITLMGWRTTFAILGVAGLLLSVPLVWLGVQDEPRLDHGVSDTELAYINAGREMSDVAVIKTHRAGYVREWRFWLAVLGGTLDAFCNFGLLNWLPTYFNRAKGIDFERLGWPLALVFALGIVGIVLMAYLGDKFQIRTQLASVGFLIAGVMVYIASTVDTLELLVLFFALAIFSKSAYAAQEYAIVQHLLPANQVGAGTGLYNGIAVLFGGVGGSLIPGSLIATTGSFDAGMLSIVVGAVAASLVMFVLARMIRY